MRSISEDDDITVVALRATDSIFIKDFQGAVREGVVYRLSNIWNDEGKGGGGIASMGNIKRFSVYFQTQKMCKKEARGHDCYLVINYQDFFRPLCAEKNSLPIKDKRRENALTVIPLFVYT